MRRVIIAALTWLLLATSAEAANLCVKSGGSDATAKASLSYTAGNEAGSTCWATLGRAVWGNASRATPSSAEGAAAGDTVYVFGGTYDSAVVLGDRTLTVYTTVNDGTTGNPIVYRCLGVCTLTAPAANSVLLGQGDDYIEWRADLALGHRWVVPTCFELNAGDDECGAGTAAAVSDFSSVACISATGMVLEGFYITGTEPAVAGATNWNGLRIEACESATIRNIRIRDITRVGGGNHNQSCVTIYRSDTVLIEHIDCENSNAGIYFKDTAVASPVLRNVTVSHSLFVNVGECLVFSLVTAGSTSEASYFSQNICSGGTYGIRFIGSAIDGAQDDVIANNTFYDMSTGMVGFQNTTGVSGVQIVNNVFFDAPTMLTADSSVTWPGSDTVIDLEHNTYTTFSNFYSGSDGTRTFAGFNTAYTGQNDTTPVPLTSDPLIANAAGGDYRICTAAGVPHASCSGASPAIALGVDILDLDGDSSTSDNIPAGAYVTGNETIGLDTDTIPPSSGPIRLRIRGEN